MLRWDDVSVRIGQRQVLHKISFSLRPHRLTALVGQNGSGKSTLISCVNRQVVYTGRILEGEKDLSLIRPREWARGVAVLPQTVRAPHITGWELVALGREPYLGMTGRLTERDRMAVLEALKEIDGEELAGRFVDSLSGGERQRLALAMILAQNTPIALLDEPTAHLDPVHEERFLQTLTRLKSQRKKTFLVAIHDLNTAVRYADDLVVLRDGAMVFSGTKEECLERRVLEETFGVRRFTVPDGARTIEFFCP